MNEQIVKEFGDRQKKKENIYAQIYMDMFMYVYPYLWTCNTNEPFIEK